MLNYLFAASGMIFALSVFRFQYVSGGVDRAYLGLYKGVAESSVIVFSNAGYALPRPYFSIDLFKQNIEEYLSKSLSPYVGKDFKTSYLFANTVGGKESEPNEASVLLECALSSFASFSKRASFVVTEGKQ